MATDRFFVGTDIKTDFQKVNAVSLQYPVAGIGSEAAAAIHVNPGKLVSITKRLFLVDKNNPTIFCSANNTEFYGFTGLSRYGDFLHMSENQISGDYIAVNNPDGIVLSDAASNAYSYIVAITYEFGWLRTSGRVTKASWADNEASWYIVDSGYPVNMFVNGYDLDNASYDYDDLSKTVTVENATQEYELSVLRSIRREYGFIREMTVDGRGIIKVLNPYTRPLLFVNGEAMDASFSDFEVDGDKFYITGAAINMSWCVMELADLINNYDMYYSAGTVPAGGKIPYDQALLLETDGMVLFVDGLLVSEDDVIRDTTNNTITTASLAAGQQYIILKDKYNNLFDSSNIYPAIKVGRNDESVVYIDSKLIVNDTAFVTAATQEDSAADALNGEIRMFMSNANDRTVGAYRVWDEYNQLWQPLSEAQIAAVNLFGRSYDNTVSSVKLVLPTTEDSDVRIWAFNLADYVGSLRLVRSVWADNQQDFTVVSPYTYGIGALSVWVNGVRQHSVTQLIDGTGFQLKAPVSGKVTYMIEAPSKGLSATTCEYDYLTKDDMVAGAVNAYRTHIPLFPGRVTLYVNGVRQPRESYVIVDANTIKFKDESSMLVGLPDNFPTQYVSQSDGAIVTLTRSMSDEILVEVRPDTSFKEQTITFDNVNDWDIDIAEYGLPPSLLTSKDEVMIYVNGLYTGLRSGLGYRKDSVEGKLTILSPSVVEAMTADSLQNYFQLNPAGYDKWKARTGQAAYLPKQQSRITLEWR